MTLPHRNEWCNTCEYFVQHYTCLRGKFCETDSGICIHGKRIRRRRATDQICENWSPQGEDYVRERTPSFTDSAENRKSRTFLLRIELLEGEST